MQNKNLKLKLGLCGLALTSFLAVNAHSVVHADTVQNNNADNNAITWDSDNDDSQTVKEEPEQEKVSQSVQKQVPVQSHVQASQSQPVQNKKTMVSDVSSTSVSQQRVETSTVRSSSEQRPLTNQNETNKSMTSVQNNRANLISKVDSATSSQTPVQIVSPNNNQIIVHYVDIDGRDINSVQNSKIDVTKQGNSLQYAVPDGYVLANNKYTITENTVKEQGPLTYYIGFSSYKDPQTVKASLVQLSPKSVKELSDLGFKLNSLTTYKNHAYSDGINTNDPQEGPNFYHYEWVPSSNDGTDHDYADGSINLQFYLNQGSTNDKGVRNSDWGVAATPNMPEGLPNAYANSRFLKNTYQDLKNYLDKYGSEYTSAIPNSPTIAMYRKCSEINKTNYTFTDNSGQVKKVNGNTINLAVTQPVPVNDASQTRKTAERIISVNLPDDQGARDRYKGMLNANNQIVQTITFTRTMTKDNLTGAVLSQSAWQGPSSFPAVTLPDIPGYTITMS